MSIFVKQAAMMSGVGILTGLVLSRLAGRVAEQNLGASMPHTRLQLIVSALMLLTTIAASTIPARRAAQIAPQEALREL